jgi:hypothetical protein
MIALLLLAGLAHGSPVPAATSATLRAGPLTASVLGFDHTHAKLSALLADHVLEGRVRYAALQRDAASLDAYLADLQAVTPEDMASWSRDQRLAFWINAYNAYTLQLVVENYPVKSIKDVGTLLTRVWDKEFIPLEAFHPKGKRTMLSLNHIEHDILRKQFHDARIHAAIHGASESCPPLRAEPYLADRLDAQLDEQARLWLADTTRNRFDQEKNAIEISETFDWFEADFTRDAGSVQAWIARYAPSKVAAWLKNAKDVKVSFLDYSWDLNDAAK